MVSVKKESVLDSLSDEGARIVGEEMLGHNRLLRRLTVSETIDPKDVERVAEQLRGLVLRQWPCTVWKPDGVRTLTVGDLLEEGGIYDAEATEALRLIVRATVRAMQPAPLPVVRFRDGTNMIYETGPGAPQEVRLKDGERDV
jgi:hypothetical protein